MSNSNKILTVSYGNFSCTLEGFEDPFAMMKAIAEYFRGISDEDKQLGADSPQLAPEELKNFIEARSDQSIQASRDGDAFVLRASQLVEDAEVSDDPDDMEENLFSADETVLDRVIAEANPTPPAEEDPERFADVVDADLHDEEEITRRAQARLMALRKELDPLLTEKSEEDEAREEAVASEEEPVSQSLESKRNLLPEISMREESISRLLEEADNKIAGAESRRRSISIAHLKAAVAATAAEPGKSRRGRLDREAEDQKDPYRRDLARAVGKSEELERSRAARNHPAAHAAQQVPLMLVSNQRIPEEVDLPQEEEPVIAEAPATPTPEQPAPRALDSAPETLPPVESKVGNTKVSEKPTEPLEAPAVKATQAAPTEGIHAAEPASSEAPAEVSANQDSEPAQTASEKAADATEPTENSAPSEEVELLEGGDFSAFVQATNAAGLADLLEAAVAFAGAKSPDGAAPRPDIMKLVADHLGDAGYQRDEAMRLFGTLMREGRIQKMPKGRFTVPDSSPFKNQG